MKIKFLLSLMIALAITGCGDLFGPDKEGWKSIQKKEFLQILKTDKYMSICNQEALYTKVKSTQNSKLMSALLVHYANNLANSCIDLQSFAMSQEDKRAQGIDTYYKTYVERVQRTNFKSQLKAGKSIEAILKPYIPQSPQFRALSDKYMALQHAPNNLTIKQLRKIRLNIERTKLMKPDIGNNYALINVPEFKVRMIENGVTSLNFSVIVGKTNMQTPIFSERLQYVEINPQWNIPDSIMRKSYIPKIAKNPNWIAAKGMELHASYDLKSPKIDPRTVDWNLYPKNEKGYIPYKLIQIPSLKNGLGRVKFIFPNKHAVYMHDTQNKSLFKRKVRTFSHGCIRLGKPVDLLEHITVNYSNRTMSEVQDWYDSLKTRHLILNKDLQVHTVYFTAYVNELNELNLYGDIYGFDRAQHLTFEIKKNG